MSLLQQLELSIEHAEWAKEQQRQIERQVVEEAQQYLAGAADQINPTRRKQSPRAKSTEPAVIRNEPTELLLYCEGLLTMLLRAPRDEMFVRNAKYVHIEAAAVDRICRELNGLLEPHRLPKAA